VTAELTLIPSFGPPIEPLVLAADREHLIGRDPSKVSFVLSKEDLTVSRVHCKFAVEGGVWTVCDLGSSQGTYLNHERLVPKVARTLRGGDLVKIGSFGFAARVKVDNPDSTIIADDGQMMGAESGVTSVVPQGSGTIERRRLELLVDCAKRVGPTQNLDQLAEVSLGLLLEGTGYTRVSLVKPRRFGDSADLVRTATRGVWNDPLVFSRTLLRRAMAGETVVLDQPASATNTMATVFSGSGKGIGRAMCVPVITNRDEAGAEPCCFYFDWRLGDKPLHEDAAPFCQAVADVCKLALANMRRAQLQQQASINDQLMNVAMQIQRATLPPSSGSFASGGRTLRYAHRILPAKKVAGDVFDVVRIDERRVAMFMGDVSGKGVAAAIIGAMTQAYLAALLRHDCDLLVAMEAVNDHISGKMSDDKFVSLWCGIFDLHTGVLTYADAGHALWLVTGDRCATGYRMAVESATMMPLRIHEGPAVCEQLVVPAGGGFVLFSDGVIEQPSADGQQFGTGRLLGSVPLAERMAAEIGGVGNSSGANAGDDPVAVVEGIAAAVKAFAGTAASEGLADDLSVAAFYCD